MKTLQLENDELHRQFKIAATSKGILLKRATEEAIREWIERQAESQEQGEEQFTILG